MGDINKEENVPIDNLNNTLSRTGRNMRPDVSMVKNEITTRSKPKLQDLQ